MPYQKTSDQAYFKDVLGIFYSIPVLPNSSGKKLIIIIMLINKEINTRYRLYDYMNKVKSIQGIQYGFLEKKAGDFSASN